MDGLGNHVGEMARASVLSLPPLIAPGLARQMPVAADEYRHACTKEIAASAACFELTIILALGPDLRLARPGSKGSLRPLGKSVPFFIPGTPTEPIYRLAKRFITNDEVDFERYSPLSHAVLAMLLAEMGLTYANALWLTVPWSISSRWLHRRLTDLLRQVAPTTFNIIALGDLSSCHATPAIAHRVDSRAEQHDQEMLACLQRSRFGELADGPSELSWQVNATLAPPLACMSRFLSPVEDSLSATIHYSRRPFGVGYLSASITASPAD